MFRIFIVLFSFLLFSCSSEEEKEPEVIQKRHPEYRPSKVFITHRVFDYEKENEKGLEGNDRQEKELNDHKPEIEILDDGQKIVLKFPNHPHSKHHHWSWMEIVDYAGTEVYEDIPEPEEDKESFEYTFFSEKPFKKRIRVRGFCQVHGEFILYKDIPVFKKKTILDRQGPEE